MQAQITRASAHSSGAKGARLTFKNVPLEYQFLAAQLLVKAWDETYRGLIHDEYLDNATWQRLHEKRNALHEKIPQRRTVFADVGGDVAALADFGPLVAKEGIITVRESCVLPSMALVGHVYNFYVFQPYHMRGVGTAFFRYILNELYKQFSHVFIWVLSTHQDGIKFFHAQGGRCIADARVSIGKRPYDEILFCFDRRKKPDKES